MSDTETRTLVQGAVGTLKPCRECNHEVSTQAISCPNCRAPFPARHILDGWGFEYKSRATLLGLPLLHISLKYRPNGIPMPAKGIIAIGQFGIGVINISQFGIGLISVGQFTVAGFAIAQIAVAYSLIAQLGIYVDKGYGQVVKSFAELLQ